MRSHQQLVECCSRRQVLAPAELLEVQHQLLGQGPQFDVRLLRNAIGAKPKRGFGIDPVDNPEDALDLLDNRPIARNFGHRLGDRDIAGFSDPVSRRYRSHAPR